MDEFPEPDAALLDEVVDLRRHLHRHPEVSFDEAQTSHLIRARLEEIGLSVHECPTETGAVASFDGGRPGATVMLRADIDALPILEESGVDFESTAEGVMHACGHDAHTAMLLGVARNLASRAEALPGRYLFVFQPAEEIVEGARAMLEGGLFDAHHPDYAIGLHMNATEPAGRVITRPGMLWGGSDAFQISFRGPGGHGGTMGRQGNVISAQAFVVERLLTIVEGLEHEGARCHATIGYLSTDGAWNIVPRHALMRGSFRTFTPELREIALQRLKDLILETETEFAVDAELKLIHGTRPLLNDAHATQTVLRVAEHAVRAETAIRGAPLTISDDMAEFLLRVPGCYFELGGCPLDLERPNSLHSPFLRLDEAAFATGVRVLSGSAVQLAEQPAGAV